MPGIVDLASSAESLPDTFVVDTNILVEQLIGFFPGLHPPIRVNVQRSNVVFQSLSAGGRTGIISPTVLHELVHYAIKSRYKLERITNRAALLARFGALPDWTDLYKQDPEILHRFRRDLEGICQSLVAAGFLIASPHDARPTSGILGYDEMLIDIVCRYGLDSNDAALLLEASTIGITDIVTLDKDLLRAQADFTIYAWR